VKRQQTQPSTVAAGGGGGIPLDEDSPVLEAIRLQLRSLQDAVADLLRTAKLRSFLDLEDHLDRTNQRRARQIVDQAREAKR
jgi:hypothetical protein